MNSVSHLWTNPPAVVLVPLVLFLVFADTVAAQELGLAAPVPVRQLATLCGDETPCNLLAVHDAGTNAAGDTLRVVELSLDGRSGEGALCSPYPGADTDERVFALLADGSGGEPAQLLYICNDGYGVAGMGMDSVEIADNRILHTQYGGSAWRWQVDKVQRLLPFNRLSQHESFAHTLSGEFGVTYFDQSRLRGAGAEGSECHDAELSYNLDERRYRLDCGEAGGWLGLDAGVASAFLFVPNLPSGALEVSELAPLGSCSSYIGEDLRPGFLIYGDRIEQGSGATLRYLMADTEIILTVVDDRFEAGGSTWVQEDHVEIWAVGPRSRLVQWGIGIDGRVYSAYGGPPPLEISAPLLDEEDGLMRATLALELPWRTESITLVYSQAENRRQHRLVGTSAYKFGDAATLGRVRDVDWQGPLCEERNGRIELIPPAA